MKGKTYLSVITKMHFKVTNYI